jgi:hypothetical protein
VCSHPSIGLLSLPPLSLALEYCSYFPFCSSLTDLNRFMQNADTKFR